MENEVKDYPDTLKFHRFRPITEMAAEMVKGSGLTQKEGMIFLTDLLGSLVSQRCIKIIPIKDDN